MGKNNQTVRSSADIANCYVSLIAPNLCEMDTPITHFIDVMGRYAGTGDAVTIVVLSLIDGDVIPRINSRR